MGTAFLSAGCQRTEHTASRTEEPSGPADVTLHIGTVLAEIDKDHTISTIGYNGAAPGPPIRLSEGVPVTVEIFNDTDTPEYVHWHGIPMAFGKINGGAGGFNQWTINGKRFEEQTEPRVLHKGKRYRLAFDNQTDDAHPVHLHRNSFGLTNVHGKPTAGVVKDVVLLKGFRKIAADFTPAMDGLTLFHCHQQLHMDYGFKMLFRVV